MVSEPNELPFLKFLEAGQAEGGFETDDVLAALLPLMKQVLAVHEDGFVAPLDGIQHLLIAEQGHLMFAPTKAGSPEKNTSKIEGLQSPASRGVEVIAEAQRTTHIDEGSVSVSDLGVGTADNRVTK